MLAHLKRFCVIYRLESSKPEDNGDASDKGQEHEPKPEEDVHLRTTTMAIMTIGQKHSTHTYDIWVKIVSFDNDFWRNIPFAIRIFVLKSLTHLFIDDVHAEDTEGVKLL